MKKVKSIVAAIACIAEGSCTGIVEDFQLFVDADHRVKRTSPEPADGARPRTLTTAAGAPSDSEQQHSHSSMKFPCG
jgi:hypothetical protein